MFPQRSRSTGSPTLPCTRLHCSSDSLPSRQANQPAPGHRGLVRPVVVEEQVHVQVTGHLGLDQVEEATEFSTAITTKVAVKDGARLRIERGTQRRRAAAD